MHTGRWILPSIYSWYSYLPYDLPYAIGLGTKKLSFIQPGDSDDIHLVIMEAFPKLEEAGGYELARANSSRMLEIIPTPADGYSVAFLKDVIGQGKIYIRPIQRNLSLDPVAPTSVSYHAVVLS